MAENNAARMLEQYFGAQMCVDDEGRVTFSMPALGLKKTISGDPLTYRVASTLMKLAEIEEYISQKEKELEEEIRKAECNHDK